MTTIKQKAQVIILSTPYKSNIWFRNGKLEYNCSKSKKINPHDLYIVSDEEIKEGDWVLNISSNEFYQCNDISKSNQYKHNKKIIATTDTSLTILEDIGDNSGFGVEVELPQPSQEFIEKYIKEYNKGNIILNILVQMTYDIQKEDDGFDIGQRRVNYRVKINSKDNTITIHPIKDSWNREEVIKLCKQAYSDGASDLYNTSRNRKSWTFDHNLNSKNWIKNNL